MTTEAQARLARYLEELHGALRNRDPDEIRDIECDVRSHIEAETQAFDGPLSEEVLGATLERLGPPAEWLPESTRIESAWYRRPDPWAFALFFLGLVLVPFGIGILIILASYLVSRVACATPDDAARRWLLMPQLTLVSLALQVLVLLGPAPILLGAAADFERTRSLSEAGTDSTALFATAVAGTGLGLWWIALGLFLRRRTGLVPILAFPFQRGFGPRHVRGLTLAGAISAVVASALALLTS